MGIQATMHEDVRLRAQEDLGIELEFSIGDSAQLMQQTLNTPDSFDLIGESISYTRQLRQSNIIQSIDAKRLSHWDEVGPLNKTGYMADDSVIGAGDAPHKVSFLKPDGSFASEQTDSLSFVPHLSSPGSFAYNADIITSGVPYETESWSWMLDPQYHGKVATMNDPSIATIDLGLAAQASGLMQFEDIGDMTMEEVNHLMAILLKLKSEGHFAGFWTVAPDSVDFFSSGRAVIESMYASTVYTLKGQGQNVRFATPKEGYRGWQEGMFLSARTEGRQKDMAYEYMDWWLSGWAGAYMAKNGYYISTPQLSRPWMSVAEWDYWYEGKPAAEDLKGVNGGILIPAGEIRSGGSYQERMGKSVV